MNKMFKAALEFVVFSICIIQLSCTGNLLRDIGDNTTDEALFYSAKQNLNSSAWAEAITNFSAMSSDFLADREVKFWHASAYAGRCGYDFLTMLEDLQGATNPKLFAFFMAAYGGATATSIQDCVSAEAILTSIGDASDRSPKENLFMMFLSLAKIGVVLSARADTDDDGLADGGFDACDTNDLPDSEARHLGTAIANANLSLAALAASGVSVGTSETAGIGTFCTALGAAVPDPSYDFCNLTDISALSADQVWAIRTAIQEGDTTGIGSCTDFANAFTPQGGGGCLCP